MIVLTCLECGHAGRYRTTALAQHHFPRHSCAARNQRMAVRRRRVARQRASGERRDCHHKIARHEHGSRLAYVLDRCRCRPCRNAARDYEHTRTRDQLYGRPGSLIDATPAREHLHQLLAAGMGLKQIARVSGIGHGALYPILYVKGGQDPRPRRRRITRRLEQRILAVHLELAAGARVDATGTRRRLRALIACGWTQTGLARRLGWTTANLGHLVHDDVGVAVATQTAVTALYDQLWDQPPPAGAGRTRSRRLAVRYGWAPPMAWDDDTIDDPTARPIGIHVDGRPGSLVHRLIDLLDTDPAVGVDEAICRLGTTRAALDRALYRAGRRDLLTHLNRPLAA